MKTLQTKKKENLVKEKNKLQKIYDNLNFDDEIDQFFNQLMTINKKLWNMKMKLEFWKEINNSMKNLLN